MPSITCDRLDLTTGNLEDDHDDGGGDDDVDEIIWSNFCLIAAGVFAAVR